MDKWRKRIVLVIVCLIFMTFAIASGEDKENEKTSATENNKSEEQITEKDIEATEAPTEEPTPELKEVYLLGEVADLDKTLVQVVSMERSGGGKYDSPKEGMEYIIVTIVIKNTDSEKIDYNAYEFSMSNSNGQLLDEAFTIIDSETALGYGELLPGGKVKGTIVFEQPKDDTKLMLVYEPSFWNDKNIKIDVINSLENIEELQADAVQVEGDIVPLGEYGELFGAKIKILNVEKSSGTKYDSPKEGMEYIIVTVEINNKGSDNLDYNPYDFDMLNSEGQITNGAFTIIDSDTSLGSGELLSGGKVEGTLAFEQTKDDSRLLLIYQPNMFSDKKLLLSVFE